MIRSKYLVIILISLSTLLHSRDAKISPTVVNKPVINHKTIEAPAPSPKDVNLSKKKDAPIKLSKADKRKRKRNKPKKLTMREMDFDQLKEMKDVRIAQNDLEAAIKYAEKLIPMCKDMHELKDLTLELADLLFKQDDKTKAGKLYAEFVKLYPGSDEVAYANYQAIVCSFAAILAPTRDQTATKETLELTQKFLDRADVFDEHVDEVIAIQRKCYETLVQSEFAVIDFYFKKGSLKAVENRLNGLRKDYLVHLQTFEPQLMSMEIDLAFKQNKNELATQKLALFKEKFPALDHHNASTVTVAQNTTKKSMTNRF